MQYLTHLRDTLLRPLLQGANSAVGDPSATILMMDAYGLSRDDVFDTMAEFKLKGSSNPFLKIGSKTKAAFTRKYNAGVHMSQALGATQARGIKRKKYKGHKGDDDSESSSENEEDKNGAIMKDDDLSAFRKQKKKNSKQKLEEKKAALS